MTSRSSVSPGAAAPSSASQTVAHSAAGALTGLSAEVAECRRCPRLVAWREEVAIAKRAAFRNETYWGRPVPGFGDPGAWLLIVGLAPAAHGANRTGRMFTGDRSGDWLYRALHKAGLASQTDSISADDGLTLSGAYVTASVRCAPPANKPTAAERASCRPWLERELDLLPNLSVIVALGGFAWNNVWALLKDRGFAVPTPRPKFGHGAQVTVGAKENSRPGASSDGGQGVGHGLTVIGSYHPSQQNTFTGRLTEPMFDDVWEQALQERP